MLAQKIAFFDLAQESVKKAAREFRTRREPCFISTDEGMQVFTRTPSMSDASRGQTPYLAKRTSCGWDGPIFTTRRENPGSRLIEAAPAVQTNSPQFFPLWVFPVGCHRPRAFDRTDHRRQRPAGKTRNLLRSSRRGGERALNGPSEVRFTKRLLQHDCARPGRSDA